MFKILIWSIYGLIVGSISKGIVPGNQNFGLIQTITFGIIGSYVGGAIMYLLGNYDTISPAGIVMGAVGASITILVYKKLSEKK